MLWIIIPSAPASIYSLALKIASSIPASSIKLSILAIIMKSSVTWEFFPAIIFSLKLSIVSWVCFTSLPSKEFFLSPILSSITTAETPNLSKDRTANSKCSVLPPVSASKIIGFVVTSKISLTVFILEVMSIASISGLPLAVESVKLLDHIASNSICWPFSIIFVFSVIKPDNPLCDSFNLMSGLAERSLFNIESLIFGVVPISFNLLFNIVDEIPFVYGISTNSPPQFFNVLITSLRTLVWEPFFQSSPWTTKSGFNSNRLST